MDPIRPIGPVERDLEPVFRVTRSSPDGEKQQREQPQQQRREPRKSPPPAAEDDRGDGSLIDVRV